MYDGTRTINKLGYLGYLLSSIREHLGRGPLRPENSLEFLKKEFNTELDDLIRQAKNRNSKDINK